MTADALGFTPIAEIAVRGERDVVAARRHARDVAKALGLEVQDQARVATAVSELARATLREAHGGGSVTLGVERDNGDQAVVVRVRDGSAGVDLEAILDGRASALGGTGAALMGARRLMDELVVESSPGGGSAIIVRKRLPRDKGARDPDLLAVLARHIARAGKDPYADAIAESAAQNQELLRVLAELRERNEQLARLDRELEDTNRGVVALYAELDQRALDLQRADETKTRFLSNVTHEFRTPLNSIRALCDLLADEVDGTLSAGQRKQVSFIREAAEDLGELVDDLLDLARIQAGKEVVRPGWFTVDELFSTLRGALKPLAVNAAVTLRFESAPELVLHSDEQKVAQILRNFVSNALKFTEAGEVQVAAGADADAGSALPGVVFTVADTGIGILPEHHAMIFEEFVQIDSPLARKRRGTGLGLPLCRRLATLLGGTIELDSTPGRGSTFTLRLPRGPVAAAAAADAPDGSPDADSTVPEGRP